MYAPQTKILEGETKDELQMFDRLFNGSSPKSSTHALEECFIRNPDFLFCFSFQNLRLGGIKWVCVSLHLNDDLICDSMTMCQSITSMTMFQSRLQDDDSMMMVSIETHGTFVVGTFVRVVLRGRSFESC